MGPKFKAGDVIVAIKDDELFTGKHAMYQIGDIFTVPTELDGTIGTILSSKSPQYLTANKRWLIAIHSTRRAPEDHFEFSAINGTALQKALNEI